MFSSCSNEIFIIIPGKISLGFVLCDALKFLIYKKTDGFAYLNMHCHLFLGSQSEIMYI